MFVVFIDSDRMIVCMYVCVCDYWPLKCLVEYLQRCLACHSSTSKRTIDQFFFSLLLLFVTVCKLSLHRVYWPSFPYVVFHIFLHLFLHHAVAFFLFKRIQCAANVYIKMCFSLYGFYI